MDGWIGWMDERMGMHVEHGSSLDARLMEIIGSSAAEMRVRRSISVLFSKSCRYDC